VTLNPTSQPKFQVFFTHSFTQARYFRARSSVHNRTSPLETRVDLLPPSMNSCLNRGLLRGECFGQVEFSFHDSIRLMFLATENSAANPPSCSSDDRATITYPLCPSACSSCRILTSRLSHSGNGATSPAMPSASRRPAPRSASRFCTPLAARRAQPSNRFSKPSTAFCTTAAGTSPSRFTL
jgi:hypothetical protein